ncbi:MAG TPA: Wzz/FepE/Etk N-terminal domain-containing protein [Flavobacteriales bacterium]
MTAEKQGGNGLLPLMWERRRTIIGVTLLGLLGGIVASFILPERFKSTATVFPAWSSSISRSLLNEFGSGQEDILRIGDEGDAEKLIQMLMAAPVRDRVIAKRDLAQAYGVSADDPHRLAKLSEAWLDHVDIRFTRYGSVAVTVTDEKPQLAADVANDIIELVDTVWLEMERERAAPGLVLLDRDREYQRRTIAALEDSMRVLQRAGVNDYRTQSERFNAELARAVARGDDRAVKALEARLAASAEKASHYLTLETMLERASERLVAVQVMYQKVQGDLVNNLPRKLVVERAVAADKKSEPVRWLVVLMCTLSALLLAVVLVAAQQGLERIRRV